MSFTFSHPRRRPAPRSAQPQSVPVFIAYGDVSAAREAIEHTRALLGRARREFAVQPMLWRFDQLGHSRWREMALHDATRAHAIVLAMGNTPALDAGTDAWLTMLTERHGGAPITCLALLRGDEAWTISLQRCETNATSRPSAVSRATVKVPRRVDAAAIAVRAA